eukprot:CAMPEP_0117086044 /NCGR_PEP_ID=MMETSP0472-20121206/60429_1 /TAXON_ID=693140 ORGANISM="Tiarina fusus, Strain LIS" /NCGR_SAMPLE_ID=MMETSP0472 /ASSEMBLY_ACC=CAM_ASM_000603 /LENGTH=146 /DNA_ID=CAMNT_0004815429 /DNA_START=56 /DNA_END=496 /DNA_ORIENTATION=-
MEPLFFKPNFGLEVGHRDKEAFRRRHVTLFIPLQAGGTCNATLFLQDKISKEGHLRASKSPRPTIETIDGICTVEHGTSILARFGKFLDKESFVPMCCETNLDLLKVVTLFEAYDRGHTTRDLSYDQRFTIRPREDRLVRKGEAIR